MITRRVIIHQNWAMQSNLKRAIKLQNVDNSCFILCKKVFVKIKNIKNILHKSFIVFNLFEYNHVKFICIPKNNIAGSSINIYINI